MDMLLPSRIESEYEKKTNTYFILYIHCTNNTVSVSSQTSFKTCRRTLFIVLTKKTLNFESYVFYSGIAKFDSDSIYIIIPEYFRIAESTYTWVIPIIMQVFCLKIPIDLYMRSTYTWVYTVILLNIIFLSLKLPQGWLIFVKYSKPKYIHLKSDLVCFAFMSIVLLQSLCVKCLLCYSATGYNSMKSAISAKSSSVE